MNKTYLYITSCMLVLLAGCISKPEKQQAITVTIEPQRYFAEQLADSFFQITVMVPPGSSPETYDPTPVQMAKLSRSLAYFRIGRIGFEEVWMDKIRANDPDLKIVDTSRGIHFLESSDEEHHHHEGEHHHHAHAGGVDPHIWSSPKEALAIVRNMYDAFCELNPGHKEAYTENLQRLEQKILQTDSIVSELLKNTTQRAFIIYHPALSYLARDYGLTQYCIEMDGKEPSPNQLKELVETAKEKQIRTIFVQQEFDRKNAELIARETACTTVVINPLAYDWSGELIRIAKALSDE